jgi:hypothetical protein
MDEGQAAAALRVPVDALRRYEAGDGRLTALRLLQFAGLLGAPLTAMFRDAPRETTRTVLQHVREMGDAGGVEPDQRELLDFLHAWLTIPDEAKRARMAEALIIAADD